MLESGSQFLIKDNHKPEPESLNSENSFLCFDLDLKLKQHVQVLKGLSI